jgi:hypothetical protein
MRQITVIAEDRPGVAADLASTLGAAGINIDTLDAEAVGSVMVAMLTVDRYDDALRALTAAGFHAFSEDVLVVRVEDRPGALGRVMQRLKEAGINVRSLRFVRRRGDFAFVAIATDRKDEAQQILRDDVAG